MEAMDIICSQTYIFFSLTISVISRNSFELSTLSLCDATDDVTRVFLDVHNFLSIITKLIEPGSEESTIVLEYFFF